MLTYRERESWEVNRRVIENEDNSVTINYNMVGAGSTILVVSMFYKKEDNTTIHITDRSYSLTRTLPTAKQRITAYHALNLFTEDLDKVIEKYNVRKESGIRVY